MWITAGIFVGSSEASFIIVIKVPYAINKKIILRVLKGYKIDIIAIQLNASNTAFPL
ncbi:MAG: hypothetical protein ACTS8R_01540 [Arsenophonus sp. NC-QC1-MAG3]